MEYSDKMRTDTNQLKICDDAAKQYWETLLQHTRCYAEKIGRAAGVADQTIDTAVRMSTGRVIDLTLSKAAEVKGERISLVSECDENILNLLYFKEKSSRNREEIFFIEQFADGTEDFFLNAIRSKKDVEKYLKSVLKDGPKIASEQFCSNARLLLTFKNLELRKDAIYKRCSLRWLGVITNLPKKFQLEDFWYYEQKTGVNLSVELSAFLDRIFNEYKGDQRIYDNRDIITEILCDCIEDNYCYIACIPAINWKQTVMKMACSVIVHAIIDMLHGKSEGYKTELDLIKLSEKVLKIKQREAKRGNTDSIDLGDVQTESDFVDLMMKKALSNAFNQILCLFVVDALWCNIFCKKSVLSNCQYWMNAKHDIVIVRNQKSVFVNDFEQEPIMDPIDEVECLIQTKESTQSYEENDRICSNIYKEIAERIDALVFCNESDEFVQRYIKNITDFVDGEGGMMESRVLKQKIPSHSETNSQFYMIQRAILTAIEASEQMEQASKKIVPPA